MPGVEEAAAYVCYAEGNKLVLTAEVKGTMGAGCGGAESTGGSAVRQGSRTGYSLEMIKIFIENSNK